MDNKVKEEDRYTQRQWDRTGGWGKVPEKYDAEEKSQNDPRYPKISHFYPIIKKAKINMSLM